MTNDREPQKIASSLADEAENLIYATRWPEAFYGQDENGTFINAAPANVSDTVNGLTTLLDRLPQVLEQTSRALQHLEEQQAIRMANGTHTGDEVSVVLRALLNAQQAIQVAHSHMREAADPLTNMGGHFDGDKLEDADTTM
ncbi:hypothetical protein [Streptomyces sp. NPDC002403]